MSADLKTDFFYKPPRGHCKELTDAERGHPPGGSGQFARHGVDATRRVPARYHLRKDNRAVHGEKEYKNDPKDSRESGAESSDNRRQW